MFAPFLFPACFGDLNEIGFLAVGANVLIELSCSYLSNHIQIQKASQATEAVWRAE